VQQQDLPLLVTVVDILAVVPSRMISRLHGVATRSPVVLQYILALGDTTILSKYRDTHFSQYHRGDDTFRYRDTRKYRDTAAILTK